VIGLPPSPSSGTCMATRNKRPRLLRCVGDRVRCPLDEAPSSHDGPSQQGGAIDGTVACHAGRGSITPSQWGQSTGIGDRAPSQRAFAIRRDRAGSAATWVVHSQWARQLVNSAPQSDACNLESSRRWSRKQDDDTVSMMDRLFACRCRHPPAAHARCQRETAATTAGAVL